MSEHVDSGGPETDEARFAENMRRRREVNGWSQGELARRMREAGWDAFHQTTISRVENGERPVRLGEARAIAQVLGTGLTMLLQPVEEARLIEDLGRTEFAATRPYYEIAGQVLTMMAAQEILKTYIADAERSLATANPVTGSGRNPITGLRPALDIARRALLLTPEKAVKRGRAEFWLTSKGQDQMDELLADFGGDPEAFYEHELGMDEDDGEHPETP